MPPAALREAFFIYVGLRERCVAVKASKQERIKKRGYLDRHPLVETYYRVLPVLKFPSNTHYLEVQL